MATYQWKDTPTSPGWYWLRKRGCPDVEIAYFHDPDLVEEFDQVGSKPLRLLRGYEWFGPIKPPMERTNEHQ